MTKDNPPQDLDPIRLTLMNSRFEGVARKMANTLMRTGRSGVLSVARDFSCCIVTADGDLLCANEALPIHTLSGPDIMAKVTKEFHPDLQPGDAFLNNSPYHGCSHAADHTLIVPVFDEKKKHRFTVLCKAHQADIGNSIPTTYHSTARDLYEEGALIFPSTKVQEKYQINADFERMCRLRIRVPDQWWGDFIAMTGAARTGEQELIELANEFGWDALEEFSHNWFDYSDRCMYEAIRELPSGHIEKTSIHDPIPGTPAEGIPVKVMVSIDSTNANIVIDLAENMDCLPCGLNLSEACSRTAAMVGIFNSIDHTIPKNAGAFRRIKVKLRENCVVGIPVHPTSTSAATTNLADRVANAVQVAMAELAEGKGLAECGAITPASGGVISGYHPQKGAFVNQVFLGLTGGAAAPGTDAWLTICHVGNAGLCNVDSIELDEQRQPLVVYSRTLVADTEGAGEWCGAQSCEVEFGPLDCEMTVVYTSDGEVNPPKGVRGGLDGGRAKHERISSKGTTTALSNCEQILLQPGDRIRSTSTGGGGYGVPTARKPQQVATDVFEGRVSRKRAAQVYQVILAPDGSVDQQATSAARSSTT